MILSLLACCSMVAAGPLDSTSTTPDRSAYEAARSMAGRDAEANVKLALWCEAHGFEAERVRHLALAILADPGHQTARGLMGLVSDSGRWSSPEAVAARIKADPDYAARRLEYDARRARTQSTADDHARLAAWCEEQGLTLEARAHYTNVTRLDPSRDLAWKKLGCRKYEGRWMTPDQVEAYKFDRELQARADKHWPVQLEQWKAWLSQPTRRAEAEAGFNGLTDPRAVPSICKLFAPGGVKDQARAVRLLGQVDSLGASKSLAAIAVFGDSEDVRRSAVETLRGRDLRGVLDSVINLFTETIKYTIKPGVEVGSRGVLLIEGKDANVARVYGPVFPTAQSRVIKGLDSEENQIILANAPVLRDAQSIDAANSDIIARNARVLLTLKGLTGKDHGYDKLAWVSWWTDHQGYALKAASNPRQEDKPTYYFNAAPSHSCFAAGTPVRTIDGPKAIESIKVGDRLLTQDTTTGLLGYQPAVAVFRNPPALTFLVRVGDEVIIATGIHRFWKAGTGWTMARDLKPGDPIRHVGGIARVESVDRDKVQPVFNIEVAHGDDFFVGKLGVLVHDNSIVHPVAKPFDAATDLARAQP